MSQIIIAAIRSKVLNSKRRFQIEELLRCRINCISNLLIILDLLGNVGHHIRRLKLIRVHQRRSLDERLIKMKTSLIIHLLTKNLVLHLECLHRREGIKHRVLGLECVLGVGLGYFLRYWSF